MSKPSIDDELIRRRAYELSLLRPEATAEDNWLTAESQLLAEEEARRLQDVEAEEREADLMAHIKMSVLEHS